MPEGELSRKPRERLRPLIQGCKPDLRSCVTITRSLIHVFYNVHYIDRDRDWVETLEALKSEGVLYHEVFKTILELFDEREEWKPLIRDMNILQDMRPDYLFGRKRILCVVERPPKRPLRPKPSPEES